MRVRSALPYALVALAALAVAAHYARLTLSVGPLGFPLDDAYIYMTYAKQAARGHPFTYFDGGGYSAGATSVLWPLLTAPMWALGLRGQLFVWGIFVVCAGLLAATACLTLAIARRVFGPAAGTAAGLVGAALIVASGTLTWGYLSGMEIALCGTLLLACGLRLLDEDLARPSRRLLVLLAGAALARPEASLLVGAVAGVRALAALRRRELRGALRWLVPLAPVALVALMNRALAGHFTPNTALVKSHIYLPGIDASTWLSIVEEQGKLMLDAMFWNGFQGKEPVWAPRLMLASYLVGATRLLVAGWRARRMTGALFLALAPLCIFAAVIGLAGVWRFHNYRYLAAALPVLLCVCGLAVAPPRRVPAPIAVALGLALAAAAAFGSRTTLARDLQAYAQQVNDLNVQMVPVGKFIHDRLPPGATVAVHDVGIIGYYGEHPLLDVIGLITNGTADDCNHGPGSRFEEFERMSPAERPRYFAYYPGWLLTGSRDLFGKTLLSSSAPGPIFGAPRLIGGGTMEVLEARWDLLGSGAAPFATDGWSVVDEVDVADLESERRHGYRADMGPRQWDTRSASGWVYLTADRHGRRVADGGRTIRGPGGESFTVEADPAKPLRLLVRGGGPRNMAASTVPGAPQPIVVSVEGGRLLGRIILPAPADAWSEIPLDLPADPARPRRLRLHAGAPGGGAYRVFHWFVLQPR